jgi:Zn-dependent protease with chaperone function/Zn-finger nucleic acid-binding protein
MGLQIFKDFFTMGTKGLARPTKNRVMRKKPGKDFYERQSEQWRKSLFLFTVLLVFYFLVVGLALFTIVAITDIFRTERILGSGTTIVHLLWGTTVIALTIAFFHYYDARKHGAKFIRKRLQAKSPDPTDRYHKQFINTLEEIRIAAGLPRVQPFILPTFAINSMALMEADNTPSVLVTEGLLAEFTRDELQAVTAHELAHIIRGDTFYITLVCSLANFFERLREAVEPDWNPQPGQRQIQSSRGGPGLVYFAFTISAAIMHLLSTLISRQREILADAAAVELNRHPKALAQAIYKAHLKNSFVGDFNLTYSPLLIVPPRSTGITDGFFSRLFNSHPPLMKRVRILANMIPARPARIIQEVWKTHKEREKARIVLKSLEESKPQEGKIWIARDSGGQWTGPFTMEELLSQSFFTPRLWLRNLQEKVEAQAQELPQFQRVLRQAGKGTSSLGARRNHCPRCQALLYETFYEGVPIKICPDCGGKLIDAAVVDRVIARKEVAFSEDLKKKAQKFEQAFLLDPIRRRKIHADKSPKIHCPQCGTKMFPRPYNYQYIIPVDKCLACHKIWFDRDELEILQILIEY